MWYVLFNEMLGLVLTIEDFGDLAAEELRQVQGHLSEIVGITTVDDLLGEGEIFGSFCIGK